MIKTTFLDTTCHQYEISVDCVDILLAFLKAFFHCNVVWSQAIALIMWQSQKFEYLAKKGDGEKCIKWTIIKLLVVSDLEFDVKTTIVLVNVFTHHFGGYGRGKN